MRLLQEIGGLQTQGKDMPEVGDLPKALEFYGARIGRDLGILHKLTGGKITIGFIVETATIYEHCVLIDPDDIPERTPQDIFEKDLIPYMNSVEVTTEDIGEDDEIAPTKSSN